MNVAQIVRRVGLAGSLTLAAFTPACAPRPSDPGGASKATGSGSVSSKTPTAGLQPMLPPASNPISGESFHPRTTGEMALQTGVTLSITTQLGVPVVSD